MSKIILRLFAAFGLIFAGLAVVLLAIICQDVMPQLSSGKLGLSFFISLVVTGVLICFSGVIQLILPLLNRLKFETGDSRSDYLIIALTRMTVSVVIILFSLMAAFGATMGPQIMSLWEGRVDIVLRISTIAVGFATCIFMMMWLILPLLKYVYKKLASKIISP